MNTEDYDFACVTGATSDLYPQGGGVVSGTVGETGPGVVVKIGEIQRLNSGSGTISILDGNGDPYPNLDKNTTAAFGPGGWILNNGLGFSLSAGADNWIVTYRIQGQPAP